MDNKESIFNYIEKNIQRNGKLSDKFDLSRYRHLSPNDLKFADGMIDYCIRPEEDDKVLKILIETMQNLENDEVNLTNSLIIIDNYYAENPKKTILATIDNFLRLIVDDSKNEVHQFSISLIYKWALYMMLFGKEIETVKIGIALIGLFPLDGEDKIIELLEKLSLCEEFTKYTSIALNNTSHANEIKFRLAKKLNSYGKIILVDDLDPNTEEIKEWLLCNGCSNDASNGWIAINIAQKINIPEMMHNKILSEDQLIGLYDIVEALISEGPQPGISVYEQKEELFTEIVNQYNNFKTNIVYLRLLSIIKDYCEEKFNCDAYLKIKNILNSDEIRNFIKNEIDKGNKIAEYTFISNHIDNFNIYENVFNVFKNNAKQNMDCIGYLFKNTPNIDELLLVLRENINLNEIDGDPEPIIEFSGSIDLISIIQYLAEYSFLGQDFIIAGLRAKTMHPRNAALRTIIDWKKKTNTSIKELPEKLKIAINELKEKEVIKSYKEMINEILEIEEDLSSYNEPEVIYGLEKEESLGISIFDDEIDTLFSDTIRYRGKDYFDNDMIHHCELCESKYISYVQGTDFSTEYKVVISVNKENEIINMECNCPYQNNCKHEYATLLYIRNNYKKSN